MSTKSASSSTKIVKNYTPNASELNTKIEVVLKEDPEKDWKAVCEQLKTENPTWLLPDRRVSKFVKRVKSGSKGADDDKSVRTMGSRLFSSRKKKAAIVKARAAEREALAASAAKKDEKQEEESLQPAMTVDTDMSAATPEQSPPDLLEKVIETTPYHDDNDGKKFGCWCQFS